MAYDSDVNSSFVVTKPDGTMFIFEESDDGLHYLDTSRGNSYEGTTLVNTVAENKSKYTHDDYLQAVRARELQIKIGRPSTRDYIAIIKEHRIPNCPVTVQDIRAAEHIFGPNVASLKGKTVRRQPPKIDNVEYNLPTSIMKRYSNVTLCADVMHVNGNPILITMSRKLHFITAHDLPS